MMAKGFSSFSPSSLSPPPDEEDGRVGNTLKAESNILMSYTQQAVYNIQHTDGGEKEEEEEKKDVLVPIYSRRWTSEKSRKTQHETPRKKSKKKNLQTPSSIMLIGGVIFNSINIS